MNSSASSPSPDPEITSRYEKTHLRGRPFVLGTIIFFLFMGGMYAAIWGLMRHWSGTWPLAGQTLETPTTELRWSKQAPVVQIDPEADLERLRQLEYRRLHRSQWDDPAHAYAAISIEDATKLLAESAAEGRIDSVLPPPQPATPLQLQDQKSREVSPPQLPNP